MPISFTLALIDAALRYGTFVRENCARARVFLCFVLRLEDRLEKRERAAGTWSSVVILNKAHRGGNVCSPVDDSSPGLSVDCLSGIPFLWYTLNSGSMYSKLFQYLTCTLYLHCALYVVMCDSHLKYINCPTTPSCSLCDVFCMYVTLFFTYSPTGVTNCF